MTNRSINQIAQDEGDTSRNEAARIRAREAAVAGAWRAIAYNTNTTPHLADVARKASEIAGEHLGPDYCRAVCERRGDALA